MTAFAELFQSLESLEKGRKAKNADQLTTLAGEMDSSLGKWEDGHGTRQDAVQHFLKFGRSGSLAHKDAAPGTPEGMAYRFATDQMKHARMKVSSRSPVLPSSDTLSGPIDKDHIDHYAQSWASHFDLLDHAPRNSKEVNDEMVPVLPGKNQKNIVHQRRTGVGEQRIKHMKTLGQNHVATMDDLDIIHSGVERAIQTGKVQESDANRYHVMRATMKKVHQMHPQNRPGVPFAPSYASMDTRSLRVMQTGLEHVDDAGFREAKTRLSPVLSSAIEAHDKYPYADPGSKTARKRVVSLRYPNLHPMGSLEHQKQETAYRSLGNRVATTRSAGVEKVSKPAAKPAAPAAQSAAQPATSEVPEWKRHLEEARKRRAGQQMDKAFAAARLLKSLKQWRVAV